MTKEFDAAIIGGGVIGCSIAWRLAQNGMRVVVIERGEMGREASWAAGGILGPLAEADRADEFHHLAAASRAMYPEFARELQEASGIDIEYRTEGTLHLALAEADEVELEHRWSWQHAAGLNVKRLNRDCVLKLEPAINPAVRWALKFPDDHQVDNRRLAKAVEIAAKRAGATMLPLTEAAGLLSNGAEIRGVRTSRGEIPARTVILAAGSWSTQIEPAGNLQIEPVRGQMISLEMPDAPISHVIYSCRAYLVPRHSGYVIAGSTTENVGYDKRVTAGGIASIIERAVEIAPALAAQPIVETWAGLRPKLRPDLAHDEWPVLGRRHGADGLIYATGHYRNGILLTPITARIVSELALRGASAIDIGPFSPMRFDQARRSA
ncbi:MAG: glycine oxidase ThiO [Blastocatellia bacterium]|nr:glycine oxidase ThiO [Blastocatellia bacterium]